MCRTSAAYEKNQRAGGEDGQEPIERAGLNEGALWPGGAEMPVQVAIAAEEAFV
jgi:hypothetical protein